MTRFITCTFEENTRVYHFEFNNFVACDDSESGVALY